VCGAPNTACKLFLFSTIPASELDYTIHAMSAVSIRGNWVGRKIDGRFPLIAWLGGSDSNAVFLTEIGGPNQPQTSTHEPWPTELQKAAIRLVPASAKAEDRLAIWNAAASLSHPNLVRIFRTDRAEIDEVPVIYLITELAEENLGQILPERTLTTDETRDMLAPILDALSYLHEKGLVHGHLRPSNILVVENEVKLSSDGLLRAGKPSHELPSTDLHNAPELAGGSATPAADVWSLGITLVESLTQQLPFWDAANEAEPEVPATLPNPFSEIVRECLHANPARRCSLNEIRAMLEGKHHPAAEPVLHAPQYSVRPAEPTAPRRIPLVPLLVGLVLLVAIIIGLLMHNRKTQVAPLATETTQQTPPAEPESRPAPQAVENKKAEVINRVVPNIPSGARNTIHGTVSVTVHVSVDSTGTVSDAELANRGPSAYFARMAVESARNWKFQPEKKNGSAVSSAWLLHYAFRRDGTEVTPVETSP
jgi:TonB family protein